MSIKSAVIIPIKNRSTLIRDCVATVQAQTLPISEIIIVDDGSEDETPDVLRRLANEDPRIKLLRFDKSVGAAAARNAGIQATTAEWILFLDSDDRWHRNKHASQAARLREHPEAIASFTGYVSVMGDAVRLAPAPSQVTLNDLRGENIISTTSSAMVRHSALQEVGGFDAALPSCQDWDLWLKLMAIGEFAMVQDCLVDFVLDASDRISRNPKAVIAGHTVVFERALTGVTDWRARRRISSQQHLRLAEIYAGDVPNSFNRLKHAVIALLAWPGQASRRGIVGASIAIISPQDK